MSSRWRHSLRQTLLGQQRSASLVAMACKQLLMCGAQALALMTPDGDMLQSEVAYEYFRDRFSVTSQQPYSQARLDGM